MGKKKELRLAARQLGRGELEEEFVRLTVENARLQEEVELYQRRSASIVSTAREFDIWNR